MTTPYDVLLKAANKAADRLDVYDKALLSGLVNRTPAWVEARAKAAAELDAALRTL